MHDGTGCRWVGGAAGSSSVWFESLDGWLPSRGVFDTTLRAGALIHFRFKRAHAPQVGNVFSRHFLRLLCPSHVSARSKKQRKIRRADAGAVEFDLGGEGKMQTYRQRQVKHPVLSCLDPTLLLGGSALAGMVTAR
jgi:hypothetical protein